MRFFGFLKIRFPILFTIGICCVLFVAFNMATFLVGVTPYLVFLKIHTSLSIALSSILLVIISFFEFPPFAAYVRSMYLFPISSPDTGFLYLACALPVICSGPLFCMGEGEFFGTGLFLFFFQLMLISIVVAKPLFVRTSTPLVWSLLASLFLFQVANLFLGFGRNGDELRYEIVMNIFFIGYIAVNITLRLMFRRKRNYYIDAYDNFLKKGESCTMFVKEWYGFDED
jgi:hypothetical protein